MILKGVAVGLGRYPVHAGRGFGKTRTFAVVRVSTLTEKWIYSEGRYKGGVAIKVRCPPDFIVQGQEVRIRVPDRWPGADTLRRVALDDPNSEGISGVAFIPHIVES